jgi:hypothetical protein
MPNQHAPLRTWLEVYAGQAELNCAAFKKKQPMYSEPGTWERTVQVQIDEPKDGAIYLFRWIF